MERNEQLHEEAEEALDQINKKTGRNMPQAIATGAALVILIVACLLLSIDVFVLLVVAFMILALWELRVDFATVGLHIPVVMLWICSSFTLIATYYSPYHLITMSLSVIVSIILVAIAASAKLTLGNRLSLAVAGKLSNTDASARLESSYNHDGGEQHHSRLSHVAVSVLSAVRQISAMPPEGFGISARNITVSTVGVVPGIKKLTAEGIPVRLAVSLHAPSDELRDELVPMNKRFNTTQVLDAAHDYWLASKRRVSIEYALMRGINDQAEHAQLLAKRLNHYGDNWAHVNPIPLNPIEGSKWTASKPEDEKQFLEILHRAGITATLRDTRGQDIDGACGQLAAKER